MYDAANTAFQQLLSNESYTKHMFPEGLPRVLPNRESWEHHYRALVPGTHARWTARWTAAPPRAPAPRATSSSPPTNKTTSPPRATRSLRTKVRPRFNKKGIYSAVRPD